MVRLQDMELTSQFMETLFDEVYEANSMLAEYLVRMGIGEVDEYAVWGKMPLESITLKEKVTAIDFALSKFFVTFAKQNLKHTPKEVVGILEEHDFDVNAIFVLHSDFCMLELILEENGAR